MSSQPTPQNLERLNSWAWASDKGEVLLSDQPHSMDNNGLKALESQSRHQWRSGGVILTNNAGWAFHSYGALSEGRPQPLQGGPAKTQIENSQSSGGDPRKKVFEEIRAENPLNLEKDELQIQGAR